MDGGAIPGLAQGFNQFTVLADSFDGHALTMAFGEQTDFLEQPRGPQVMASQNAADLSLACAKASCDLGLGDAQRLKNRCSALGAGLQGDRSHA